MRKHPSKDRYVGIVADNPNKIVEFKNFHARIVTDKINRKEKDNYFSIPAVWALDQNQSYAMYMVIKQDVQNIADVVMEEVLNDPAKSSLFVKK